MSVTKITQTERKTKKIYILKKISRVTEEHSQKHRVEEGRGF